ncbi:rRNA methyltransferase [Bacillus sp. FJAT-27225]|uniref:class I SAM-dependent methyltransferase n=1 Tax=Bacillus sp. FJAT-27225 TaxID=1743144 RepID=UPI00080C2D5E|nr:class I SAM-dependent methyltransferase [Bacillus sp. FJAT-27225]OCA91446.1 rRNA methyltransferase [Bacillus sp. FJAT-27225]
MKLDGVLPFARGLLQKAVQEGGSAIDATMGNGHDTLFLANLVGEMGRVFSFDIQAEAIEATSKRLEDAGVADRAKLFQTGHENAASCIPESFHGKLQAAIFNLGYLPGSDKTIITKSGTTISAVEQIFEMLSPDGIIVLVVYHGHEGGAEERDNLLKFAIGLDQKKAYVLQYGFINQKNNPPFIVAIEKR